MSELSSSNWSETPASNDAATPNGWPEGQTASSINDCAREMMAALKKFWNRIQGGYVATGSSNAYVLSPDVDLAAYVTGERYSFRANFANTGSATLNISSLGAKTIKKMGSSGKADIISGDIQSGQSVTVEYDGTDLVMVTPTANSTSLTGAALTASSNTFTADQTIRSSDAGASTAPTLVLDRNSASPAVNDQLGGISFNGRDSGGNLVNYGAITGLILDPTDGSEDGRLDFWTSVAGTLNSRMFLQQGLFMSGATGSDKGAGTINAAALYDNGVKVASGTAKAWVSFDGTQATGTIAAAASFGVASITKSGTGIYVVTWSTAFATAEYVVMLAAQATSGDNVGIIQVSTSGQAAGSVTIKCFNGSNSAADFGRIYVTAFGDL